MANHVHDAHLKSANFVAQHLRLTLLQTHRTVVVWTQQMYRRQQLRMPLKKVRRVGQEISDVVFRNGIHRIDGGRSHACLSNQGNSGTSISPSNTEVAGPVIHTD